MRVLPSRNQTLTLRKGDIVHYSMIDASTGKMLKLLAVVLDPPMKFDDIGYRANIFSFRENKNIRVPLFHIEILSR